MDGKERKEYPPLPPDYVSFAQLQERWLQKQEEEKLKRKQEEEKKRQEEEKLKMEEEKKKREAETQNEHRNRRGLKNDGLEKISGGSVRDAPPGKDGREMGAIQVKGKGKEAAIGDSENGDGDNWKKKKNKKKRHKKKKSVADGVNNGNEMEKEKPRSEIIKECDNGSKGIDEIGNDSVLPKDAVRNEIPDVKRLDIGGGFRRNGGNNNRISGHKSKTEYRVRVNEKKETEVQSVLKENLEGEKGHGKKRRGRRNAGYRESIPDKSKGNDVEQESVKNADDEICSEICGGFNGIKNGRNDIEEEHRVEEEEVSDDNRVVSIEKKVDDEVLVVESATNGEKGRVRNVYNRRNWNWKENINREIGGKVRSVVDGRRYGMRGRYGDGWKMRTRESGNMMWVKKEDKLGAGAAEEGSSGISIDQ